MKFSKSLLPLFYQTQDQMRTEGAIVVGILVVLGIIAFLWINFVSDPKDEKEKENWIKENIDLLNVQQSVLDVITLIGESFPACKKCNSINFQLWNIVNDSIEVRCESCKKKIFIDFEGDKNVIVNLLGTYIGLVDLSTSIKNEKLRSYLNNYFIYDFFSLRANSPYVRAIKFTANPTLEPIENHKKSTKNSRRISQKVKNEVWKRDEGKCVQCGSNEKLEFDHIIPFSKGGANTYRNIQLLCESCNRGKSDSI